MFHQSWYWNNHGNLTNPPSFMAKKVFVTPININHSIQQLFFNWTRARLGDPSCRHGQNARRSHGSQGLEENEAHELAALCAGVAAAEAMGSPWRSPFNGDSKYDVELLNSLYMHYKLDIYIHWMPLIYIYIYLYLFIYVYILVTLLNFMFAFPLVKTNPII